MFNRYKVELPDYKENEKNDPSVTVKLTAVKSQVEEMHRSLQALRDDTASRLSALPKDESVGLVCQQVAQLKQQLERDYQQQASKGLDIINKRLTTLETQQAETMTKLDTLFDMTQQYTKNMNDTSQLEHELREKTRLVERLKEEAHDKSLIIDNYHADYESSFRDQLEMMLEHSSTPVKKPRKRLFNERL